MFYLDSIVEELVEYATEKPYIFLFYALIFLSPFFVASSYYSHKIHRSIEERIVYYKDILKQSKMRVEKWNDLNISRNILIS